MMGYTDWHLLAHAAGARIEAKNERKGELMLEILDLIEWALNIVWGD
jgi:hypothetical protein